MFRLAPLLYFDIEMFGRNWRENDVKNDVKIVIQTKADIFLAPVVFMEIPVGYMQEKHSLTSLL